MLDANGHKLALDTHVIERPFKMKFSFLFTFLAALCFQTPSYGVELVNPFFKEAFKKYDIIALGENHKVADDKETLMGLLKYLAENDVIDSFAFEFINADAAPIFEKYIHDPAANPGTEIEADYFEKLQRIYTLFDTQEYDDVVRYLRVISQHKPTLKLCPIDYTNQYCEQCHFKSKLDALKSLPKNVQNRIGEMAKKSIEEVAKGDWNYDREALMATNVASCASTQKKTLVYVGLGHSMKSLAMGKGDWQTVAEYMTLLQPGKLTGSALMLPEQFDSTDKYSRSNPFGQPGLLKATRFNETVALYSNELPANIAQVLKVKDPSDPSSIMNLTKVWDIFVFGPTPSKSIQSSKYKWR